ncbi:MAG: hypothetical protein ACI89L_002820, partial [Phycisphaerales bacterium]
SQCCGDPTDDLCVGLRLQATTPDRVTLTARATDPTAQVVVTQRDQLGNPLGSFTMDQTQAASVIDPNGVGIIVVGGRVERRAAPGGGTVECAICHLVADPGPGGGGGGGTTVTSPTGISFPNVFSVEVCVTTPAPFDAKHNGHVTVLKAHDPGGGSGTTGDMAVSGLGKGMYEWIKASQQARTTVQQCDTPTGPDFDLLVANLGSSGLDGVSMDLTAATCRAGCPCDDDCDGDIDEMWMAVKSMDGNGGNDGELRLKIAGKKTPTSPGGGDIKVVFVTKQIAAPGGIGSDTSVGVSIEDDGLSAYEYRVRLRVTDAQGSTLADEDENLYPSILNDSPDLLGIGSSGLDGRYSFSPSFATTALGRELLYATYKGSTILPSTLTLLRSGQVVQNAAAYEITLIPIAASPVLFHEPVSMDMLFTAPPGETSSVTITDSGFTHAPPPCQADINGDGVIDNGDIGVFITLFLAQDPAVDFTGDGIVDNGDIGAFIAAFLAGCP